MLPPAEKLWGAYFQAVTPRTAGFNTTDIGSLHESTITLLLLLMFVGAGSASTGGGIKLTTFLVILLSVITFLKGKKHISIAKKNAERPIDHSFARYFDYQCAVDFSGCLYFKYDRT